MLIESSDIDLAGRTSSSRVDISAKGRTERENNLFDRRERNVTFVLWWWSVQDRELLENRW